MESAERRSGAIIEFSTMRVFAESRLVRGFDGSVRHFVRALTTHREKARDGQGPCTSEVSAILMIRFVLTPSPQIWQTEYPLVL